MLTSKEIQKLCDEDSASKTSRQDFPDGSYFMLIPAPHWYLLEELDAALEREKATGNDGYIEIVADSIHDEIED